MNELAQRAQVVALIYDAEQAQNYIEVDRLRGILDDPAQFAA